MKSLEFSYRRPAGWQVVCCAGWADSINGAMVHELECAWDDGLSHDAADGIERVAVAGVAYAQGGDRFRCGKQLQGGFGDECECAFRTDQQAAEVVAGDPFGGAAAGADFLPAAGDGAKTQHEIAGDAVLDGARPGGIHGQVAADAAIGAAAGVGRIKQAGAARDTVDFFGDHAGLNHDKTVVWIEFEHAFHAFKTHDDTAGSRQRTPNVAGAGTARR